MLPRTVLSGIDFKTEDLLDMLEDYRQQRSVRPQSRGAGRGGGWTGLKHGTSTRARKGHRPPVVAEGVAIRRKRVGMRWGIHG